jgi:hypothetical protein
MVKPFFFLLSKLSQLFREGEMHENFFLYTHLLGVRVREMCVKGFFSILYKSTMNLNNLREIPSNLELSEIKRMIEVLVDDLKKWKKQRE